MRALVIYCHHVDTSFDAALHQEVVKSLRSAILTGFCRPRRWCFAF